MIEPTPAPVLDILVVEDEEANRMLLRAVFGRTAVPILRSASLREAETLAEARTAIAARVPDLIILDVRLPDGSGLDLARELASGGAGRPAVMICSASVLNEQRDSALRSGADAFLGKPYRPTEVVAAVLSLLEDTSRV